jgi:geranylgeranylglycerol-phosphate geranylgeranyltransferase
LVIGIGLAILTKNTYCLVIALFNSLTLFLYAFSLKKTLLIGNLIVAWNASSTFLYGALISSNLKNLIPLIVIAFIYTIIREFVKTIEDYDGDKREKVKSVAVVFGKKGTVGLLYVPIVALIVAVILFGYKGILLLPLAIALGTVIIIPLIIFMAILHRSLQQDTVATVQKFMKLNMFIIVLVYMVNDVIVSS